MTKFQLQWQVGKEKGSTPPLYDDYLEAQGIADTANKEVERPLTPMSEFWWVAAVNEDKKEGDND